MSTRDDLHDFVVDDIAYRTRLPRKYLERKPVALPNPKRVKAVIPGVILSVLVEEGQPVRRGDGLLILEAMKMQNPIMVPVDGTIGRILVKEGALVAKGDLLVEIE